MGVQALRNDLLRLLKTVYNFNTESYVFNANDSWVDIADDFRQKVIEVTKPKEPDSIHLLVYYYSGHSDPGPRGD